MTALYTAGLVARCDQRPLDIIEALAEAMAGKTVYVEDQLFMRAGAYIEPVIPLGDSDFAAPVDGVQSGVPREDLFNIVNGKIIDDMQGWKADIDVPEVRSSAYIALDGGVELPIPVEFEAVHSSAQAQQLAAVMMRYSRQAMQLTARFKMTAYRLQVFDTFLLTCSDLGITAKPFEVLSRKWAAGAAIELFIRETDPSIYEFGNEFDSVDPAPNTEIPLATSVAQLQGLTVISGTTALTDGSILTRTKVSWLASTDLAVIQNGKVEIQYRNVANVLSVDWASVLEPGSAIETLIVGLQGGNVYVFRARFINGNGVRGLWSYQGTHTVAQPPRVGGINMLLNPSFEQETADIADHWIPYTNGTTGAVTHADGGAGSAVYGIRAQRIDATNLGTANTDRVGYLQTVNVTGLVGTSMTLSAYVNGTTGVGLLLHVLWYANGSFISDDYDNLALTTTYARRVLTATVPATATHADCAIYMHTRPSAPGAAYFIVDAAQMEGSAVVTAFGASAEEAVSIANAAAVTAENAAEQAALAEADLAAIANNDIISKSEKPAVNLKYLNVINEEGDIRAKADALRAVATTGNAATLSALENNYSAALAALTYYLNTYVAGWNTMPGQDINLAPNGGGALWNDQWNTVYQTRQLLLNQMALEASRQASWGAISGNKPFQYRILAAGYSSVSPTRFAPDGTFGLVNMDTGATVLASVNHAGYGLVVINKLTGAVVSATMYDTYSDAGQVANLTNALNATTPNQVVVLFTQDEPKTNAWGSSMNNAIYRCGGSRGVYGRVSFKTRSAYVLIGAGGMGKNNGWEAYAGETDSDTDSWIDVSFSLQNGQINVSGIGTLPEIDTTAIEQDAATSIFVATHLATAGWSISE